MCSRISIVWELCDLGHVTLYISVKSVRVSFFSLNK